VLNYRSYPKIKLGIRFLDHPVDRRMSNSSAKWHFPVCTAWCAATFKRVRLHRKHLIWANAPRKKGGKFYLRNWELNMIILLFCKTLFSWFAITCKQKCHEPNSFFAEVLSQPPLGGSSRRSTRPLRLTRWTPLLIFHPLDAYGALFSASAAPWVGMGNLLQGPRKEIRYRRPCI